MFNSRDPIYKSPVGAVEEGTPIHFKIRVPRSLVCTNARVCVHYDSTREYKISELFWCGMDDYDQEYWECHVTPEKYGLYYYYFELRTSHGILQLTRQPHSSIGGIGNVEVNGYSWQQTVYKKGFTTPDWLSGGVMYQIFPDRFYASGGKKENVPEDRWFHKDWLEEPAWRPDAQGEVKNNDYFGGDLKGITAKLPYLKSLGVTCLYLNPIFEAHSNHRYNTADYSRIDPVLGTEEDFVTLCEEAEKQGIRLMLDGVFSHTGSDSLYFNKQGRYKTEGAYQSKESPYFPWYSFHNWPTEYESWWNFDTLPNVIETNPQYDAYINGKDGIVQRWLKKGAAGWRLDVADELPDEFIDSLSKSAKEAKDDAIVLGEVWEDASNKMAYGVRRRYLLGGQLDSVMNYPFRDAILGFLTGAEPSIMMERILSVLENYPPQVVRLLMNHIGTHDTERAITVLAGEPTGIRGRDWQSVTKMTSEQWHIGLQKMRLASLMQYTLPGVPCVYYGDEAGVEGYKDPFNRTCYPWGEEDTALVEWYRQLGKLRGNHTAFAQGIFRPILAENGMLVYVREDDRESLLIALNSTPDYKSISLPHAFHKGQVLLGRASDGKIHMDGYGYAVVHHFKQSKAVLV